MWQRAEKLVPVAAINIYSAGIVAWRVPAQWRDHCRNTIPTASVLILPLRVYDPFAHLVGQSKGKL